MSGGMDDPEATARTALAHCQRGEYPQAERLAQAALAQRPALPLAKYCLGFVALQTGREEEARALFIQALRGRPRFAEAHYNLGIARKRLGDFDGAIASFAAAVEINPRFGEAWINLGNALARLGYADKAVAAYENAARALPRDARVHHALGEALSRLDRLEEAVAAYGRALALRPDYARAAAGRLYARLRACAWDGLESRTRTLRQSVGRGVAGVPPFLFFALDATPAEQLRCARLWSTNEVAASVTGHARGPYRFDRGPRERLRLGYLSGDFRQCAQASLLAELIEVHDRGRFEVFGLSYGPDDGSAMRRRLAAGFDAFVELRELSTVAAADRIHAAGVDILLVTKGYTQDNRCEIASLRPAPIQVGLIGFPGTMGAPFIDYLIADRFVAPPEEAVCYDEKLVTLPENYQVNDGKRSVAASPATRDACGLPPTGFVFCNLCYPYKLTPQVFSVWMRLLNALPGSVFWLFAPLAIIRENLKREAVARGVDPARLLFADKLSPDEHLARYRLADLFLDTLPCNGHTTVSDALWAGCPVLTCVGQTFAGRVGQSLLHAVGLPELVAPDLAMYESLALALARDPERLRRLREKLAATRSSVSLFDANRYARHVEQAYETMWSIYRAGDSPRAFAVPSSQ